MGAKCQVIEKERKVPTGPTKETELLEKNKQLEKKIKQLEAKLKNLNQINLENKVDLSPEEIQRIMEENIDLINYKNNNINLLSENNQLKLACYQYQLMLLSIQNQYPIQNFNNNNMNYWRTEINNLMNNNNNFNNNCFNNMDINNNNNFNNNFNGINNNVNNIFNNNNNFSNNNNNLNNMNCNNNQINNNRDFDKIKTIIFQIENGKRYPIGTFDNCQLKDVFNLVLVQINNEEFSDENKLKFVYNTHDVTKHFLNNDKVRILNLPMSSVIEVNRIRNAIETKIIYEK